MAAPKVIPIDFHKLEPLPYFPQGHTIRIKPNFAIGQSFSLHLFIASMEQLIESLLPEKIMKSLRSAENEEHQRVILHNLHKILPLFTHKASGNTISVTVLCPAEYTSGVGRYVADMLNRWAYPGKHWNIVAGRSLTFECIQYPAKPLYLVEHFLTAHEEQDRKTIMNNLPLLFQELRINILAVYYARYIVSIKSLSLEQKMSMIEENISSLLSSPTKIQDSSIYDEMQQFLIKLSAERKIDQVKENISYLMHRRPKTFDPDVFYEMKQSITLFKDKFIAQRDHRHISRVMAYLYLFKKTVKHAMRANPNQRYISLKILKTFYNAENHKNHTLGILITLNLSETERFEKRHILESIKTYIPDIQFVKDTYLIDRPDEKIRTFYLEVEKAHDLFFTLEEIKNLKRSLLKELPMRIEHVLHPIFMPRNEEEVIRNIITLAKQLRFLRDIPQAIISYEQQTHTELVFAVIFVRTLREKDVTLAEQLHHLSIHFDESKVVGYIKRRYPKEANLFRIHLPKAPFLRKDSYVDLQKARQVIVHDLTSSLGNFRDFNGGMIVKQNEVLQELLTLLPDLNKEGEFLLENFFYSLRPAIMQSLLPAKVLKELFLLHQMAIQECIATPFFQKILHTSGYILVVTASTSKGLQEKLEAALKSLKIHPRNLTLSHLLHSEITAIGYIYRNEEEKQGEIFLQKLTNCYL